MTKHTVYDGTNRHNSKAMKSHPKGEDNIKFKIFHQLTEAIKMKLPNSRPTQVNTCVVEIE